MAPSVSEQYIVDEKGNPTAVILPIKEYRKMLSIMDEVEAHRESRILSQSSEFKKLVKKGLDDIGAGRTRPWKEAWDEL
jgi:antitoxin (DNA-binding transcriptional repressor) of toxin-antitoxin stability system